MKVLAWRRTLDCQSDVHCRSIVRNVKNVSHKQCCCYSRCITSGHTRNWIIFIQRYHIFQGKDMQKNLQCNYENQIIGNQRREWRWSHRGSCRAAKCRIKVSQKCVQVSLDKSDDLVAKNPFSLSRIRSKEGYFSRISRIRRPKIVRVMEGPTCCSPTYRGTAVLFFWKQNNSSKGLLMNYVTRSVSCIHR